MALIWLAVALAAGVAEVLSLNLVLAMVAGGAVAAAVASAVGAGVVGQTLTFAAGTAALLGLVRPALLNRMSSGAPTPTNVAALVGRRATALTPVTATDGRVRLAGEEWSARCEQPTEVVPVGTQVVVLRIDGAVAVVASEEPGATG